MIEEGDIPIHSLWGYVPKPGAGVAGVLTDDIERPFGTLLSFNAIEDAEPEVPEGPGVLFVRSGWAGADGPPAWMPGQRARAMMGLEALERMAHGRKLVLWPRATDAVSDVPSILTFLRGHPGWEFMLDPMALMTEEMLPRRMEHAMRMLEALGAHPALAGIVVPEDDDLGDYWGYATRVLPGRVALLYLGE